MGLFVAPNSDSASLHSVPAAPSAVTELFFSANSPPISVIAVANIAGIVIDRNPTLPPGSQPKLVLDSGHSLHGANVLLRYIGRISSMSNLYGEDDYQKSQIDEWIDYAHNFASGSEFEETCNIADKHLLRNTFLVGDSLSLADVSVWAGLVGAGRRWDSLRKSRKYLNLVRWFDSISREHDDSLNEWKSRFPPKKAGDTDPKSRSISLAPRNASLEVDLPFAEFGKAKFRFAPEPSGYLHIGHAKAALLNQYYADRYSGEVIIRFDDTNPSKESNEFVDNLLKDIDTLGIKYSSVTYTSDYFPQLMAMAEKLIREGKAYVDDTPCQKMRDERGDGIESRCRNNSVEENLDLWQEMIAGSERGATCCLRGKLEMQNSNKSLRDPVYYRCNSTPHHRIGTTYKLYPTYDFCCPFVDAVEGITHALRSREYLDRNEQYDRIQTDMGLRKVHIVDFSRLNMVYTVLSKRKLLWFVQNGIVEGWDDPRFPTVQGIVRKGLQIKALKQFILEQGLSKHLSTMDWDKLWAINKRIIDSVCPRHSAVIEQDRVLLCLSNGPDVPFVRILPRHKKYEAAETKTVNYCNRLWIDYADAEAISLDEEATLKDWGNVIVKDIKRDDKGVITQLVGVLHLDGNFKTTKLKLTWLPDSSDLVKLTLVKLGHLITTETLEVDLGDEKMKEVVNPFSRKETSAIGEHDLRNLKYGDITQLERKGYYRVDVPFVGSSEPIVLFSIPDGKPEQLSYTTRASV